MHILSKKVQEKKSYGTKGSNYGTRGSSEHIHRKTTCHRCGYNHRAETCRHKTSTCNYCKKVGHIEPNCYTKKKYYKKTNLVTADEEHTEFMMKIQSTGKNCTKMPKCPVELNGVHLEMGIDTGSAVTLINEEQFNDIFANDKSLEPTSVVLKGYTGAMIHVLGEKLVTATIAGKSNELTLRVVKEGPALIGRDWLQHFTLPWKEIFTVKLSGNSIQNNYPELFSEKLGKLEGVKVHLQVDDTNPKFMKARTVPFAIRSKLDEAIKELEDADIIERVESSQWASPLVSVLKSNGKIRLCGDYSETINKHTDVPKHPIPTLEELMYKMSGGEKFTKLDLSQAYHQLELDEESKKYTTLNTHQGLIRYKRLMFGVNVAVTLFQREMENVLKDLPGVCVFLDDILVTGKNEFEHRENLDRVLSTLQKKGLKVNKDKFYYMMDSLTYLGYTISKEGLSPTKEKVEAFRNAPAPTSKEEVHSFIGSINFYRRFVPGFGEKMAPLYELLKNKTEWRWGSEENTAFENIKKEICINQVLSHYSPEKEVVVQVDASAKGVGAVLLQPGKDGVLHPVGFASRVLTPAEKHYSQIEREGLAVVFGVTKFRQYLLGRKFVLQTDHKALTTLFCENKNVPLMASSRIKRWAILLAAYDYKIEFLRGKENVQADFLSRCPLSKDCSTPENDEVTVLICDEGIVNAKLVAQETLNDKVLKQVLEFTKRGWVDKIPQELNIYFKRRHELVCENGILLWGDRVIIPMSLRKLLLQDLHMEHFGIVKMKQLARRYLWWPGLDEDIELSVKSCRSCEENAKDPKKEKTAMWSWPAGPWKRLHIDFAGPFQGKMFLVVVDAYSKYLDITPMATATSSTTIKALRTLFSHFGLPEHIVSDNGSQFTSEEFRAFLKNNDILHTCTAPGHPATNGLAERYVGFFKRKMTATQDGDLETKLLKCLLKYRVTPTSNGKTPAELLMGRQPRIRLNALRTSTTSKQVAVFKANQGFAPKFVERERVWVKNYGRGPRWIPGYIVEILSPRSFNVQVGESISKRHVDQLRKRLCEAGRPEDQESCAESPLVEVASSAGDPKPAETEVREDVRYPVRDRKTVKRLIEIMTILY